MVHVAPGAWVYGLVMVSRMVKTPSTVAPSRVFLTVFLGWSRSYELGRIRSLRASSPIPASHRFPD